MIELYSVVQKRKEKFHLNLLAQVGLGIFRNTAKEELGEYEYHPGSVKELFSEYLAAPKHLGAIDDESLQILALRALTFSEVNSPPKAVRSEMLELGASAIWEAAFVQTRATHNSINTVDERLENIEAYDKLNSAARTLREADAEGYYRLSLREAFTPVLKDIVCGYVSDDTVDEIRESLAEQLDNVRNIKDRRNAEGLVGEIKVLQLFWDNYQKTGDLVAIPSTVRGGSGHYRPEETHDIDVIKQRKDKSWIIAPYVEVKKHEIRAAEFQRYIRSILAYVAPDGTVSFTSTHRIPFQRSNELAS